MNKRLRDPIAITFALGAAANAFASEESSNIFTGDVGNALWTLLVFGLLLFILGKFAWGPILSGLKAREDFIHEALEKARRDRDAAEARLKEYEERLNGARAEATAIVEEGRRDAEVLRERIQRDAQGEAEQMLERAKREIKIAKDTAIQELYTRSGDLAIEIAGRVLGRELKAQEHERLITEAIAEFSRFAPQGKEGPGAPA